MNAKEKAEELFDKFNNTIPIEALFSDTVEIANEKLIKDYNATKQCAIIAVDEMIIQNGEAHLLGKIDHDYYVLNNSYLFDIKQEIEKL